MSSAAEEAISTRLSIPWSMRFQRLRHPVFSARRARVLPRWVRRIDARAARSINGRHAHRHLDSGLRRLSRAADRGRLWFAIAGVLALTGNRRAAARGALSLVAASLIANLVGKKLFGGPRPLLKDVPVGRRLAKYPTSASFPSGHSASAAAFATGVALEKRTVGAAVAPLAAGVVYSRVHVGAHWLSDVVAGSVIGVAVALTGRLLAPVRVPQHQPEPGTGAPIELPASMDGDGVLIVMNSSAGNDTVHADPRPVIEKALPKAELRVLDRGERFEDVVEEAFTGSTPPAVLGVCGGDGSVSRMAHLARRFDVPFLVLPGGTFNHFARSAGLSDLETALRALRDGTGLLVATGDLTLPAGNTVTVLNAAAIGIYPDFVAERKKLKPKHGKWVGGVLAAWHILMTAEPVRVVVDGDEQSVWSLFISVGRNDPAQIATMQRRSLDDDVLDVRILPASVNRLHAVASLAFGRKTARLLRTIGLLPPRNRTRSFVAERVALEVRSAPGRNPGFTHDGELETESDGAAAQRSSMAVAPRSLRLYAPHEEAVADASVGVGETPRAEAPR